MTIIVHGFSFAGIKPENFKKLYVSGIMIMILDSNILAQFTKSSQLQRSCTHRVCLISVVLLLVLSIGNVSADSSGQKIIAAFFSETHNWIAPPFYSFWDRNGGVRIFGYPLSPPALLHSPEDGHLCSTQMFERQRLEYCPTHPEPYRVVPIRIGVEVLLKQGRNWEDLPKGTPTPGCDFFPETGHTLCEPFRSFWYSHGLDLGMGGRAWVESLALFGYPISEPMVETNAEGATVLTQWFERARFEYHPDNPPQYRVLLGLLGKELYGSHRTGVASVSGTVYVERIARAFVESGLFWDMVHRPDSGVNISKASLSIRGPIYPSDHPLAGVGDSWFNILVDIRPDSTFASPADFVPETPDGVMEIRPGVLEGTCNSGGNAAFFPYSSKQFSVTGGQSLENVIFQTDIVCSDFFP